MDKIIEEDLYRYGGLTGTIFESSIRETLKMKIGIFPKVADSKTYWLI